MAFRKNYSGEIVISAHNIQPTKTDTTSFYPW